MLKYKINTKTARTDLEMLHISSVDRTEAPFDGTNRVLLTCYLTERDVVHENDTVVAIYSVEVQDTYESYKTSLVEEYTVIGVNEQELSFSIAYDKYRETAAEFARKESFTRFDKEGTPTSIDYMVIYFASSHNVKVSPYGDNACTVYLSDNVNTSTEQMFKMNGVVVDNYTIRFELTDNNNRDAYDRIFSTDVFVAQNYAPLYHFKVLQENYLFDTTYDNVLPNTKLYIQKNVAKISIPFTNVFSTTLYNNINVDGFVNKQVEYAINAAAENEKDIYHPMIKVDEGKYIPIRKIKFNLHFRQRENTNWTVINERTWNGAERIKNTNEGTYKIELNRDYFSYTEKENQSDLLSYLSFTNDEVAYRKNVLKKSFIRLLFYDSTDPFKQNLLSYSTIFLDSGLLLNKYMRNINGDKLGFGYVTCRYGNDGCFETPTSQQNGIRVNRELDIQHKASEDDIEDCRLSCQFTVMDKYQSNNCSEGFYLYLWKDNVGDGVPNDIYMKVEFNHAKFGRTIPFMMPYKESSGICTEVGQIKSFKDILDDVFNTDTGENEGYTMEQFRDYSYIHFYYEKYDKYGYVYYPDECYGITDDNNTLILNLYEANVR